MSRLTLTGAGGGVHGPPTPDELIATYGIEHWRTDDLSYLWVQLEKSTHPTASDDAVAVIEGRLGNSDLISDTDAAANLLKLTEFMGGIPTVQGNGVDGRFTSSGLTPDAECIIIWVGRLYKASAGARDWVFSDLTGTWGSHEGVFGKINTWAASLNQETIDVDLLNSAAYIRAEGHYIKVSYPDDSLHVEGYTTAVAGSDLEWGTGNIELYHVPGESTYDLSSVGELLMLLPTISEGDLETIEDAIKERWGF